jgi:hypothetical protein
MDILVTQGRRARRPYIFGINAMKKNIPNPRKSALNPRKIRVNPRPQSAIIRVNHHGRMDISCVRWIFSASDGYFGNAGATCQSPLQYHHGPMNISGDRRIFW